MLHSVAKMHYEAEMSQVDIAKRIGVSTATISRLLQRARADGIVRIEIPDLVAPDALGAELVSQLGLKRAAVVEAPAANALATLAAPVGEFLLQAGLHAGSVLAIGWGRAVRAVVEAGLPSIPGILTVPATGGMQQHAAHFQVNEFVRRAAEQMGGTPHFVHAPYLPSAATRDAFLSDPTIADSVALWDRIDAAVVGVGLPHAMNSPEASAATPSEQALVSAVGDVIRHYFDAEGKLIHWDGENHMICASPEQLRRAPLVIAVAIGPEKAKAIINAARAGFISALVTDARTAKAIIEAV
ncbi:sugar-binding transcriptional regulator [Oryzicola mucosus]|uniref:Helix-turn-helix domain-containing protein n=1 Tax=Oryzicola mucosus TaxID=2767425 RepID=A0A8J6PUW9_9HYPH|nr:sugar-binding domain-containing protein [Oryzicola mucosus]MBD0415051.1 helix-turn-helix domain-containing protein [Oryzicola mucosus]